MLLQCFITTKRLAENEYLTNNWILEYKSHYGNDIMEQLKLKKAFSTPMIESKVFG